MLTDLDLAILATMTVAANPYELDQLDPDKRRYRLRRMGLCVYSIGPECLWGYHYWHLTEKGRGAVSAARETDNET